MINWHPIDMTHLNDVAVITIDILTTTTKFMLACISPVLTQSYSNVAYNVHKGSDSMC